MSRFFALILAFAFAVPALAFDVSVKANVDNAQVFVGDMFNYEIQVTAPENAIVDLPSFVGNLGSFEVKEMKNEKVTEGMPKGSAKFVWQATLNTFVSGDFLIAPQQVQAVVGSDTVKVNTDPVAVKVSMRTTGEETDILEAEDPLDDPRLPQWLFILLIVLGVIVLVVLGWFLHKKFAKVGATPRLPPYEEAVLALLTHAAIAAHAGDQAYAVVAAQHGGHDAAHHAVQLALGAVRMALHLHLHLGIIIGGGNAAKHGAQPGALGQMGLEGIHGGAQTRAGLRRSDIKGVRAAAFLARDHRAGLVKQHAHRFVAACVDRNIVFHPLLLHIIIVHALLT